MDAHDPQRNGIDRPRRLDTGGSGTLLRNQLGFLAPIQGEVGYGNAVHHVMRVVAERTKATTGCGGCTDAVCGILDWLTQDTRSQAEPPPREERFTPEKHDADRPETRAS